MILALSALALSAAAPPPTNSKAETARWMVHMIDWGVLSTISTRAKGTKTGAPFGNPISYADDYKTGAPYFFVSGLDASMVDIFEAKNSTSYVSLTLSEASLYTQKQNTCMPSAPGGDPESPLCARLVLSGNFVNISGTPEEAQAKEVLFERHASMRDWPVDHNWFVGKVLAPLPFFSGANPASNDIARPNAPA